MEAAIAALGADSIHARGLQEALRIAGRRASCLPLWSGWSRASSWNGPGRECQEFKTSQDKATAQKAVHEAEVAEGERRVAQLEVEVSKPVGEVPPQVSILQGQIDALIRERDAGRAKTTEGKPSAWGQVLLFVDAHRSSGIGGLVKRPELRFAERNRVREPRIGQSDWCLIGQGAGQVAKVGRGSVVEGQSRSMMSNLIEQSKRCCLSFRRSIDIAELIGALHGLRGVRPGPPLDPPPNPASCPDDVLESLEADLAKIIRRTTSLWCAERQVGSSRAELMESACTHSHPEAPHDLFRTGHPNCRCVATDSQHWQAETQTQCHIWMLQSPNQNQCHCYRPFGLMTNHSGSAHGVGCS